MIKFKVYDLLHDAIEKGINYGYQRAYKHTDTPSEEEFKNKILNSVMAELEEIIDFS